MSENNKDSQSTNKHVFVINGSVDVLDLVRELLQSERYNVTTTNFVPRTWDQIAALQPDLLMIDLVVGQKEGWDLLSEMQQEVVTRDIPIIVFSTDPSILERAKQYADQFSQHRYLAKPFDIDELLKTVDILIGSAESSSRG